MVDALKSAHGCVSGLTWVVCLWKRYIFKIANPAIGQKYKPRIHQFHESRSKPMAHIKSIMSLVSQIAFSQTNEEIFGVNVLEFFRRDPSCLNWRHNNDMGCLADDLEKSGVEGHGRSVGTSAHGHTHTPPNVL